MLPVWVIQLLFVVGILGGAAWYYYSTELTITNLRNENTVLVEATVQNRITINNLEADATNNEEAYKTLAADFKRAGIHQKQLLKVLHRHDLTTLATEKPGLVEKRINDATKALFEDLQSSTPE
jgi:hypothetical protein